MTTNEKTIAELVELFLAWTADNRKASTARCYAYALRPLLKRAIGSRKPSEVNGLEMEAALTAANRDAAGEQLAPDTRKTRAATFVRFQNWLLDRGVIATHWIRRVEKPASRRRNRIPTRAETVAILTNGSRAFYLIYQALRQSGARPGELCRANIGDYSADQKRITIAEHKTDKTGRPRIIPVGKKLARILSRSIGKRDDPAAPLFLTSRGGRWTVSNLSYNYRRIRDKLGLPKDLTVYLARHEHATALCEAKGIHAASVALNHSSITITERYVKADLDSIRDAQDGLDL